MDYDLALFQAFGTDALFDIRDRLLASPEQHPKKMELCALLTDWINNNLVFKDSEKKRKNSHYHTPCAIIEWVTNKDNVQWVPAELFSYINQTWYDLDAKDDKHYYIASVVKKVLDMVSFEYDIPITDLYSKFGGRGLYQCIGNKKKGKCNNTCNSGFYCHKHKDQKISPFVDYMCWKEAS